MSNDDLINGAEAVIKALVDNGVEVILGIQVEQFYPYMMQFFNINL